MSDGLLHKYFLANGEKVLHKWVHYFDIYERHFERFRGNSPTMVEVGVSGGGSLSMWKQYFGPQARIVGIDINPDCKRHEGDGIEVFIGSQDDPQLLAEIMERHPNIDIVLDDGSHVMSHMIATFEYFYPRLSPTGLYMVEDTHTCYWPEFGGGVKEPSSFIEYSKKLIDDLNAVHSRGVLPPTEFTRTTTSISFYDSVVAFERRPQGVRQAPITQAM